MNRLDKTMKLLPEVVSALQALQQEYIWIVILRVGVVTQHSCYQF
jgi:hypothetical protein